MKRTRLMALGLVAVALVGCSSAGEGQGEVTAVEDKKIIVGTTASPGGEIFEFLEPMFEERGYTLEVKLFNDYILPNTALNDGDIDANLFQHTDWLNTTVAESGYDLVPAVELYGVPTVLYSEKLDSIDDFKEGDVLALSSNPSQASRALQFLETQGLITLAESDVVSPLDIIDNPKGIEFIQVDPSIMTNTFVDVEAAFIDPNFALAAGLDASELGILVRPAQAEFYNILATRSDNKDSEKVKVLIEILTSDESRDFMVEQFKGAIVPVF